MSNTYKSQLSGLIGDYQEERTYLEEELYDVKQALAKAQEVGLTEDSNIVKKWMAKKRAIEARIEEIEKESTYSAEEYFNLD